MGNIELQREHWIDNLKGFMLLIVMGHMGPIPHIISFVFSPTDLLYVTVFFYLSGYLFKEQSSFKNFIRNKTKSLLVPYICISILVSLLDWNLYINTKEYLHENLSRILLGNGPIKASPLWFVSTLFCANIILKLLKSIKKSNIRNILVIMLPFLCYILYHYKIRLPLRFDSSIGAAFIMYIGSYISNLNDINSLKKIILTLLSAIIGLIGIYNHVGLLNYNTTITCLSFPCAIGGCYFISEIAKLYRKPILSFTYIARNGLPILGFHCIIYYYIKVILKNFHLNPVIQFIVITIAIFTIIYYITIPILHRCFPQLWGLKRKIQNHGN